MAWGMCVLKDGIGATAGMRDAFCVAVITDTDQIIVFPWNVTTPLIIWKREHIRRSGSIGNLVFLEAGRRCSFGPGLLWMYSVTSVVPSLRDGLHKYVFCVVYVWWDNLEKGTLDVNLPLHVHVGVIQLKEPTHGSCMTNIALLYLYL